MAKFSREERSFSLPAGHVRIVPNEDGYSVLFLPSGYFDGTHALIGVVVEPATNGDQWSPWHGQWPLPGCKRLEDAVTAVVDAAVAAMEATRG